MNLTLGGTPPYALTVALLDAAGKPVLQGTFRLDLPAAPADAPTAPAPPPATIPPPVAPPPATPPAAANPFAGARFFVNPTSDPKRWIRDHTDPDPNHPANPDLALMAKVADHYDTAMWVGGWNGPDPTHDVQGWVAQNQQQGSLPIFVLYNVPLRDHSGGYSAGGLASPDGYRQWIDRLAAATAGVKCAVILEPDALAQADGLPDDKLQDRYALLQYAVKALKKNVSCAVYLDAGHARWHTPEEIAPRLQKGGVADADGFAVNVSNFCGDDECIAWGAKVSALVGGKHFVIDSGRNGNGAAPDNAWCNPPGRALGRYPTSVTGNPLVDAFLWVKGPGGSDGNANGAPNAGVFFPDYALMLARNAHF